jgi:hypothetical protein
MKDKETLEEVAENYRLSKKGFVTKYDCKKGFTEGAKWQQEQDKNKLELAQHFYEVVFKEKERMYSEEEVKTIAKDAYAMGRNNILIGVFNKWFEEFKKK